MSVALIGGAQVFRSNRRLMQGLFDRYAESHRWMML